MDRNFLSEPKSREAFSATKLWNEIIRDLRSELPVKNRRRQMRLYKNCFVACDTVDWLNAYLCCNSKFGTNVSRHQTIQLLNKLHQANIIESVKKTAENQIKNFKDNYDLYRFVSNSPRKSPFQRVLHPCTNTIHNAADAISLNSCQLKLNNIGNSNSESKPQTFQRQLTVSEIENTWRIATQERLQEVMGHFSLDEVMEPEAINYKYVIHNMSKVLPGGLVSSLDKSKDLPYWLLNAMKCLALWPTATGGESCLPNYPGFEQDVFTVIKEFFQNLEEPLTTFDMYGMLISIFERAQYLDLNCQSPLSEQVNMDDTNDSFITESVEDLMIRMAKVFVGDSSKDGLKNNYGSSCPNLVDTSRRSSTATDCLLGTNCSAITESSTDTRIFGGLNSKQNTCCFETAFESASPVTRIVPSAVWSASADVATSERIKAYSPRRHYGSAFTLAARPDSPAVDVVQWRILGEKAALKHPELVAVAPMRRSDQHAGVGDAHDQSVFRLSRIDSSPYVDGGSLDALNGGFCDSRENLDGTNLSSLGSFHTMRSHCSLSVGQLEHDTSSIRTIASGRTAHSLTLPSRGRVAKSTSPGFGSRISSMDFKIDSNLGRNERCDGNQVIRTPKAITFAITALQLALLLLPPDNRRKLHQLLRFMGRVSGSNYLVIHTVSTNRILILNEFSRCVIRSYREVDYDDRLALLVVTFLMDHHETILAVPHTLYSEVQERLLSISKTKTKYSFVADANALTFCKLVTVEEYEQQKVDFANRAIADLLERLVNDTQLSNRVRKNKLKQFKKMYPEIYATRFPANSKMAVSPFRNPLQKFKVLRM